MFYFISECIIDGVPGGEPNHLGTNAGWYLNIFKTMNFTYNGYVTSFDYYAYQTDLVFVSFWYSVGNHEYRLRGKISFSPTIGRNVRTLIKQE